MGNPKQKWTSDEEEALRAGVAKHGPGKWKLIQKDPEFNQFLHSRSNIDLKDKWRNMSAAVQGSREKLRTPKPKDASAASSSALALIPSVTTVTTHPHPHPQPQSQPPQSQPQPIAIVPEPISIQDSNKDDSASAKDLPDPKISRRYHELIFEALSSVPHQTGLDADSISAYIRKRIEVAPTFKKQFSAKLKKLVQQDKLEKVDNLYRIKRNSVETNNRKENLARQQYTSFYSKVGESVEEAAKTAAFKVVEAETKSCMAAEAVKEAEKFSKLAEETDSIFLFAKEIFDRCTRGELVVIA